MSTACEMNSVAHKPSKFDSYNIFKNSPPKVDFIFTVKSNNPIKNYNGTNGVKRVKTRTLQIR